MARELFPGVLVEYPDGSPAPLTPFTLWDSLTSGNNITADVCQPDGVTAYSPVTDLNGLLLSFTGPDGWRDPIFVDTGAAIRFMLASNTVLDDIDSTSAVLVEDQSDPGYFISIEAGGGFIEDTADPGFYIPGALAPQRLLVGSTTLAMADSGGVVEINSASSTTITVPPNSSVAFPVGTTIRLRRYGAGAVAVSPGAGVTIRSRGSLLNLNGQYAEAWITKRATDEWVLTGDRA